MLKCKVVRVRHYILRDEGSRKIIITTYRILNISYRYRIPCSHLFAPLSVDRGWHRAYSHSANDVSVADDNDVLVEDENWFCGKLFSIIR